MVGCLDILGKTRRLSLRGNRRGVEEPGERKGPHQKTIQGEDVGWVGTNVSAASRPRTLEPSQLLA